VGSFDGDGSSRIGKCCERSKGMEKVGDGIVEVVAEPGLV
jgi:hypothetical protein